MKLFKRTGGHWLFWGGVVYLIVVFAVATFLNADYTIPIQLLWLVIMGLPLMCNPLARWLNMKETHMFDWMKKKDKLPKNVVPFPEPKTGPKLVPAAPAKEKDPITFYRLGLTDNNRVSLAMGYSEVTMNYDGVGNMIKQLEVFRDQLREESEK